jgi:hypothetical protein
MLLKDNKSDTRVTLSQIHGGNPSKLVNQLLDLQKLTASREKARKWVSQLRFLSLTGMREDNEPARKRCRVTGDSETPRVPVRRVPLTRRHEDNGREPYIAVSWRWEHPLNQSTADYEYHIQRPGKYPHRSTVPGLCLDRAIAFAQAHRINLIWIDKECIYQEEEQDRNVGIQAMDLVYGESKLSLGLLLATVETQWQFDCLSKLLSEDIFVKNSEVDKFKPEIMESDIHGIVEVLQIILFDERWKRSWIFQEDHCASRRMMLLVRCPGFLPKKEPFTEEFSFGNIPGELQIPSGLLRKTATRFDRACEERGYEFDASMLAFVRQYNIWNKIDCSNSERIFEYDQFKPDWAKSDDSAWFQSTSLGILSDIEKRDNQDVVDRLAIFAHCCEFPSRLDTESVRRAGYGLSTCLVALCLLNGEIFRNDETGPPSRESPDSLDMLDCTMEEFLRKFLFEFNPPGTAYHLSLIKHFRFVRVSLTQHGIETSGWLWELGKAITFEQCDHEEIERKVKAYEKYRWKEKRALDPVEICVLWILVRKLNAKRYYDFANYLVKYMRDDEEGIVPPSKQFTDKMIEAVVQGVRDGRPLRLACLYGAVQPSAVFVGPSKEIGGHNLPLAFTSWSNGRGTELEKFVSLEVRHDGISIRDAKRLYTKSWINGIWDTWKCPMDPFVFPWPFAPTPVNNDV